jgi:hypothetical protein
MRHVTPVSPSASWMSGRELTQAESLAFNRARLRLALGVLTILVGAFLGITLLVQQAQKEHSLTRLQYHDNGSLKLKAKYLAGETHGLWQRWYENGQIMESGHFFNGRPDGCWVHYYQTGKVAKRACYDHGLYEGYVVSYRQNGSIRHSRFYQKGQMTPVTPFYYPLLAERRSVHKHP